MPDRCDASPMSAEDSEEPETEVMVSPAVTTRARQENWMADRAKHALGTARLAGVFLEEEQGRLHRLQNVKSVLASSRLMGGDGSHVKHRHKASTLQATTKRHKRRLNQTVEAYLERVGSELTQGNGVSRKHSSDNKTKLPTVTAAYPTRPFGNVGAPGVLKPSSSRSTAKLRRSALPHNLSQGTADYRSWVNPSAGSSGLCEGSSNSVNTLPDLVPYPGCPEPPPPKHELSHFGYASYRGGLYEEGARDAGTREDSISYSVGLEGGKIDENCGMAALPSALDLFEGLCSPSSQQKLRVGGKEAGVLGIGSGQPLGFEGGSGIQHVVGWTKGEEAGTKSLQLGEESKVAQQRSLVGKDARDVTQYSEKQRQRQGRAPGMNQHEGLPVDATESSLGIQGEKGVHRGQVVPVRNSNANTVQNEHSASRGYHTSQFKTGEVTTESMPTRSRRKWGSPSTHVTRGREGNNKDVFRVKPAQKGGMPPAREKNPPAREKNPPAREKNPPAREKNPGVQGTSVVGARHHSPKYSKGGRSQLGSSSHLPHGPHIPTGVGVGIGVSGTVNGDSVRSHASLGGRGVNLEQAGRRRKCGEGGLQGVEESGPSRQGTDEQVLEKAIGGDSGVAHAKHRASTVRSTDLPAQAKADGELQVNEAGSALDRPSPNPNPNPNPNRIQRPSIVSLHKDKGLDELRSEHSEALAMLEDITTPKTTPSGDLGLGLGVEEKARDAEAEAAAVAAAFERRAKSNAKRRKDNQGAVSTGADAAVHLGHWAHNRGICSQDANGAETVKLSGLPPGDDEETRRAQYLKWWRTDPANWGKKTPPESAGDTLPAGGGEAPLRGQVALSVVDNAFAVGGMRGDGQTGEGFMDPENGCVGSSPQEVAPADPPMALGYRDEGSESQGSGHGGGGTLVGKELSSGPLLALDSGSSGKKDSGVDRSHCLPEVPMSPGARTQVDTVEANGAKEEIKPGNVVKPMGYGDSAQTVVGKLLECSQDPNGGGMVWTEDRESGAGSGEGGGDDNVSLFTQIGEPTGGRDKRQSKVLVSPDTVGKKGSLFEQYAPVSAVGIGEDEFSREGSERHILGLRMISAFPPSSCRRVGEENMERGGGIRKGEGKMDSDATAHHANLLHVKALVGEGEHGCSVSDAVPAFPLSTPGHSLPNQGLLAPMDTSAKTSQDSSGEDLARAEDNKEVFATELEQMVSGIAVLGSRLSPLDSKHTGSSAPAAVLGVASVADNSSMPGARTLEAEEEVAGCKGLGASMIGVEGNAVLFPPHDPGGELGGDCSSRAAGGVMMTSQNTVSADEDEVEEEELGHAFIDGKEEEVLDVVSIPDTGDAATEEEEGHQGRIYIGGEGKFLATLRSSSDADELKKAVGHVGSRLSGNEGEEDVYSEYSDNDFED